MSYLRLRLLGVLGGLTLLVPGCKSESDAGPTQRPIDATEATVTTNQRVDEILTGLADSTDQIDASEGTSIASDGILTALGNDPCSTSSNGESNATDSVPEETTNALGDAIKRLRDEAKEHVFRADLVETDDGNQVVYKMVPTEVCDGNAECLDKLTQNPLRFAVTANTDDSLNVAFLVGQDRHSPATATLSDNKISVRGNLSEVVDALKLFMTAAEQKDLPEKLVGSVEWSIEKRAPGDFVFTSAILERVEFVDGQAEGKPISVMVQPSNPTSQVFLNSNTNTIGFRENLGAIDVSAAGAAVCDDMDCGTKEQAGKFSLHLAGLTGEFSTVANASEVTFSGLGLGGDASFLALNDQRLTTVDLNPSSGRKFSMNFKKTPEGTLVTFEPELDLSIAMAMTNLSESMRVDMPEWLFNEVFDVTLGGAPKPSVLIPAPSCDAAGNASRKEQLEVVNGSLTLDATSLAQPVEVGAGMCLLPVESNASEPHPMTLVGSGACQ